MSTYDEIAAIVYPWPVQGLADSDDAYQAACEAVHQAREELVIGLDARWAEEGEDGGDPLLLAIASAARRREEAEEEIRRLVAYGREFIRPRPYTLAGLAAAARMSISGVRTCYDHDHVEAVADSIGHPSRDWRASDPSDPPDERGEHP